MRTFLATLVGAAVIATAVVSVRLHLHVAHLRYRLWALDQDRARAERELRLARADLEAAKAPRRLLERWAELREDAVAAAAAAAAAAASAARATTATADDGPDATIVGEDGARRAPVVVDEPAPTATPEAPAAETPAAETPAVGVPVGAAPGADGEGGR